MLIEFVVAAALTFPCPDGSNVWLGSNGLCATLGSGGSMDYPGEPITEGWENVPPFCIINNAEGARSVFVKLIGNRVVIVAGDGIKACPAKTV